MSTHLWRRLSGWIYQRRVPQSVVNIVGRTMIRIPLGRIECAEARYRARIYSVRLDQLFRAAGMKKHDPEDDILDQIDALIEELKADQTGKDLQHAIAMVEEEFSRFQGNEKILKDAIAVLATGANSSPSIELPLLSVELVRVVREKEEALKKDGHKSTYPNKLKTAGRAWIAIFGDHSVDRYKPSEVQSYVNALAEFPRDWAVTPAYHGKDKDEIVATFRERRERAGRANKPIPQKLVKGTVGEYASQIVHVFGHRSCPTVWCS